MFIDLHCHLDQEGLFEDMDRVVLDAKDAGVKVVLTAGVHPASNRDALELAQDHDIIRPCLGLYPVDALQKELLDAGQGETYELDMDSEMAFLQENISKAAAIGEVGMDLKNGSDKVGQERLFRKLIELAIKNDKPVIIHSRKAEAEVLKILSDYRYKKFILHCFSGKKKLMLDARDKGYSFTIPTNVVKSQQFQEMIAQVPLRQLFCETDAPFLSPYPGRTNEPAFVIESYKMIARIKGITLEDSANMIFMNYQRLF